MASLLGTISGDYRTFIDANTVRVTVVGEKALPTVELFDDNAGLVFGITSTPTATQPPQQPQTPQAEEKPALSAPQQQPAAQEDEPIELVVTGEQDGYRIPNTSAATRTDTPLRDIGIHECNDAIDAISSRCVSSSC